MHRLSRTSPVRAAARLRALAFAALLLCIFAGVTSLAQQPADSPAPPQAATPDTPQARQPASPPPAAQSAPPGVATRPAALTQTAATQAATTPDKRYRGWVLLPAAIAIVLAIALRQVIPALAFGILVGAVMMQPFVGPDRAAEFGTGPVGTVRLAVEGYLLDALTDRSHMMIILFTLLIGGLVGVLAAAGATAALVRAVVGIASTRVRGMVATWAAGLVVFFDDYANAMIIGPSMRPIADKLRISRAKLAYIVDSTAAPVASIAIIGTWIGLEVGLIQSGLDALGTRPEFLEGATAYGVFLWSIPYRFYPLLALAFVLLVALLGRDFGPMLSAERKALAAPQPPLDDQPNAAADPNAPPRAAARPGGNPASLWLALAPILVLIVGTFALLLVTGVAALDDPDQPRTGVEWFRDVVGGADSYISILYGALAALLLAVALALITRAAPFATIVDGGLDGMSRLLPTFVVLVLAWALSGVMTDLRLGEFAAAILTEFELPVVWLPLLVFASACLVSFATGTSWGTLGILAPVAVTLGARLLADLPADEALPLFYATVGAVLAGAVFGDHCSPISDTTVLSSLATSCRLEEHVWTQAPYAIVVALVGIGAGDVLCRYYDQPLWIGYAAGLGALLLILLAFGRTAGHSTTTPASTS